jgi:hypothetical protein
MGWMCGRERKVKVAGAPSEIMRVIGFRFYDNEMAKGSKG